MQRPRLLSNLALVSTLSVLLLAGLFVSPSTAQEQEGDHHPCLSGEECRELRQELKPYKRELRPLRQEKRELREQIRNLPEGEERDALIAQLREVRREIKRLRREWRPELERFKNGCRRECFDR